MAAPPSGLYYVLSSCVLSIARPINERALDN